MTEPEKTETLAAALARVQTALPKIRKSEKAEVRSEKGSYSYTYANLAGISEQILPLLGRHGLAWVTRPTFSAGRFVLAYALLHVSGERIEGEYPLAEQRTPQAMGGAITYARRYVLCAVTGVAPEDDDDDAKVAQAEAMEDRKRAQQRPARTAPARQPRETSAPAATSGPLMINTEQSKKLHALFRDAELADRDAALAYCAEAVGHPVTSTKDLTLTEASRVIDRLVRFVKQSTPPADEAGQPAPAAEPEGAPA